ncbi:MAG: class I SAM-dependent methyltransferase, partial [Myxococcales bacterium]|nr:class I SAM-dependent methyltransferase [Myxococcales bacterium]
MSGDAADKPDELATPRQTFVSRGRRALRVPITDIPRAKLVDNATAAPGHDNGNGARHADEERDWDQPSGVTAAVEVDRDPTEPSLQTEPDPLGSDPPDEEVASEVSEPSIDVRFSDPPELPVDGPSTDVALPPAAAVGSEPASEARYSEPPEELFLDDADVLSRSDIAPAPELAGDILIPIPQPPPPPIGASDAGPPEVECDEDGPWYESFFGRHYLRTVQTPTPKEVAVECDFIERALRIPGGSRVLDVGCGLGVQTVELASRGYRLVGLDISPTMISRARDEAEDQGLKVDFVRGDMRDVVFDEPFDGLLCWGTTFGYFSEEENELAIRQFHQVLKPKGTLLLEVVNRDFMIGSQPNQVWFEVDGAVCMEETDFDYVTSRLRVKRRVASHDGQERDRLYSIRLYALHEIRAMFERNGFRIDEVSGREATMGVFFGTHSPKMIIRAERLPGPFSDGASTPPPP